MEYQLRTLARNEDKSYNRLKERGVKFWSTIEIETATWFVVEALVEIPTGYKHRRWLATSVEAVARVQRQEKFHWCRVFLCIQGPLSQTGKTLFVELREAYKSGLGAHFYVLQNGTNLMEENANLTDFHRAVPQEFRLIFKRTDFS